MPPARKIVESISARSISEVSVLPLQRNRFPAPGLDAFKISIPRLSPFSVIRKARPIISISLSDYASCFQEVREDLFVGRRLFRFSLYFALDLAEHDEFIRVGLLAAAIDFQIAQDKRAFAIAFQKDEWIWRPKFRCVKHVGIRFAGSDNEAGWFCFCFAHSLLLRRFELQGNRIGCQTVGWQAERPPYTRNSASSHFKFSSQNPMQHPKQSKCG